METDSPWPLFPRICHCHKCTPSGKSCFLACHFMVEVPIEWVASILFYRKNNALTRTKRMG